MGAADHSVARVKSARGRPNTPLLLNAAGYLLPGFMGLPVVSVCGWDASWSDAQQLDDGGHRFGHGNVVCVDDVVGQGFVNRRPVGQLV